jgi:hypothetical protein
MISKSTENTIGQKKYGSKVQKPYIYYVVTGSKTGVEVWCTLRNERPQMLE